MRSQVQAYVALQLTMEFRILGPLEIADGDRLLPLSAAGLRALLAMLLLHANEVVSVDRLRSRRRGRRRRAPPVSAT
jgi:hypothetical protein